VLQGFTPREFTIILKDSSETAVYDAKPDDDIDAARRLWRSQCNGGVTPEPKRPPYSTSSPWRLYGNQRLVDERNLLLLAGVQKRETDKLRDAGCERVDQLWNLRREEVIEMLGAFYGEIAYSVALACKVNGPVLKPEQHLDIPRVKRLLYFDFETSDSVHTTESPHTYLIGCYGSGDQFVKFLARGAADEGRIFSEFFDYIGQPRDVLLYHWTDFEIHQLRRVARRWPLLAVMIEQVIDKCADLKKTIQAAVYLPVPSFSIKCVAPALGFHWRQKDIGAYQSMVCY